MAKRVFFLVADTNDCLYIEESVEFVYYNGFALSQKQRSIQSFHDAILNIHPTVDVLEISTKSPVPLGVSLSAFNLPFFDEESGEEYPIENVFQSSKEFRDGGPYRELLHVYPKEAKRDSRLKESGELLCFNFDGRQWPLEPKSLFYDWLYISALCKKSHLSDALIKYNAFTDIEFNPNKSINCQARAAALYVSMRKRNIISKALTDIEFMKTLYGKRQQNAEQLKIFGDKDE